MDSSRPALNGPWWSFSMLLRFISPESSHKMIEHHSPNKVRSQLSRLWQQLNWLCVSVFEPFSVSLHESHAGKKGSWLYRCRAESLQLQESSTLFLKPENYLQRGAEKSATGGEQGEQKRHNFTAEHAAWFSSVSRKRFHTWDNDRAGIEDRISFFNITSLYFSS